MRKLSLGLIAALLLVPILAGQQPKPRRASAATVARGRYLVEGIGMCGDCHTPGDERGQSSKEKWLTGATLGFKPILPMPVWADTAPPIAGLPGWEKDTAIRFLMTGIARNNLPLRPPMPQFRFNQQDAVAIVAYLQSLAPAK
jgi:hypothetical protein